MNITASRLISHRGSYKVFCMYRYFQGILHIFSNSGLMLHSFQGALPHLPLPRLNDTLDKVYLVSSWGPEKK